MPLFNVLARGIMLCLLAFVPFHLANAQPEILARAYEAHGAAALESAQTLEAKIRNVDIWVNQDIAPGPPWDRSSGYRWLAVDFAHTRAAHQVHTVHVGFYPAYSRRIVDGEDGYTINLQEQYWSPASGGEAPFHATTRDAKLALAPWIILDAMNDANASATGTAEVDGQALATVSARLADGTDVTLYIDPETHLLARLERSDEPLTLVYGDYGEVTGMKVNAETHLFYQGEFVQEQQLIKLELNGDVDFLFDIPDGFRQIAIDADPRARAFKVRELDPGVWFVGEAVFYQLFVEFEDFLVAVGGIGGVEKRLQAIREITDKPLRYAIVTHHHSDHLEGVRALAEAGATLIVAEGNEAVTREALGGVEGEIESVAHFRAITDGARTLEIYQIGPGAHADAMLAAYLPAEKILYTGDLLVQPPGRPMRARIPPIRDLVIAIETFGLDVERHLDPHSPRITTLQEIYEAFYK